jgi:hypothetical protein
VCGGESTGCSDAVEEEDLVGGGDEEDTVIIRMETQKVVRENADLALGRGSATSFFGLLFEDIYCFSSSGRGGAMVLLCKGTPLDPLNVSKVAEHPSLPMLKMLKFRPANCFGGGIKVLPTNDTLSNEKSKGLGGIGVHLCSLMSRLTAEVAGQW